MLFRSDSGMIFASDSRTNAGVDHVATFTKMRVYEKKDDRVIVALSSGNLAMTQGVINILDRHAKLSEEGEETIWHDGPLTRAVRNGAICYLDEVVEARKDTIVIIHPLTDDRRRLPRPRTRLQSRLRADPGG